MFFSATTNLYVSPAIACEVSIVQATSVHWAEVSPSAIVRPLRFSLLEYIPLFHAVKADIQSASSRPVVSETLVMSACESVSDSPLALCSEGAISISPERAMFATFMEVSEPPS